MITNRKSALVSGIALIIMAVTAAFTYGYVHSTLLVPGNSEATYQNIKSNSILFHAEIFGWLFILILDVIVAWALYVFFKNENKKLSMLMAALRIVFVVIFGVAIFNFIHVLTVMNSNVSIASESVSQQIMNYLESFESTWSFSLIIFGFHLLLLGVLALKSKSIHNFWGIFLVFAAVSYVIINSAKFLFPEFESQIAAAEMGLSLPMAFGEVGFAFWLVIRGGKTHIIYSQTKSAISN